MTQQERPDSVSLSGLIQPSDWPWRHWRQVRAKAPALRLNDEALSWSELCARIDHLASGFAAQGVEEGDGVLLRAWNHPRALLAWLALLQCGARVLPVNPQLLCSTWLLRVLFEYLAYSLRNKFVRVNNAHQNRKDTRLI